MNFFGLVGVEIGWIVGEGFTALAYLFLFKDFISTAVKEKKFNDLLGERMT